MASYSTVIPSIASDINLLSLKNLGALDRKFIEVKLQTLLKKRNYIHSYRFPLYLK